MRVAGTFPSRISRIENLLLAMMTSVPFSTGALMYSSFAPAPFAPFLDAPWQNFLYFARNEKEARIRYEEYSEMAKHE